VFLFDKAIVNYKTSSEKKFKDLWIKSCKSRIRH